jgi:hypothetical protein
VQLVEERDDLPLALLDLLQHRLEPLLELPAVLRAGDHGGQVQRDDALAAQRVGHVALDDAAGQPLDDRGLADARLADQDGVVLRTAREHLHDPADLVVAADDRVELAAAGAVGQVDAVLLERLVGRLGVLGGHPAHAAAHLGEGVEQRLGQRALRAQQLGDVAAGVGQPDEQVLGGDVVVADLLGLGLGDVHHGHQGPGQAGRRDVGPAGLGQRGEQGLGPGADLAGVGADGRQQRPGDAVALVEQGEQQVDGSHLGVSLGARPPDGRRHGLLALGGETFGVHGAPLVRSAVVLPNAARVESIPLNPVGRQTYRFAGGSWRRTG